jgi:predicted XRE-type DNA-binding protein
MLALNDNSLLNECQNKKCVNPNHLEVGTHQDNSDDMIRDDTVSKGEARPASKLTEVQIKKIRKLYETVNNLTQKELANQFGVSRPLISFIINRKYWKHL